MKKLSKSWIALLLALLIFLVSVVFAYCFDTQFGSVKLQEVYYTGAHDGCLMHGKLYIPANATAENPAPTVVFFPGNDGDCDKYSMIGIELSRRGYVVLVSDLRNQGQSIGANAMVGTTDTYGAMEATEYVRSLDFVDKDQVFLGGHSLGGMGSCMAYSLNPDWYHGLLLMGIGTSSISAAVTEEDNVNVILITGRDDADSVDRTQAAAFFGRCGVDEFQVDTVYGSFEEGNARLNYQAMDAVHNSEYVNTGVLEVFINFVQDASPAPMPIDGSNQVWYWRYVATTVALAALIFMLLPLGSILLNTPFFSTIKRPLPEFRGARRGKWWLYAVLTAVIPAGTYFHFTAIGTNWLPTNIFGVRRATMTLGWALMVAGITLVILLIGYLTTKKTDRPVAESYCITYEKGAAVKQIAKSLLLSFILIIAIYALMSVVYSWTLVDVRIWNSSFRVLDWRRVVRVLTYFIPFVLAYIVTGMNVHGMLRPKGGTLGLVKEIVVNIILLAPWYYVWMIWFGPYGWLTEHGAVPAFAGFMYSFFWALPITMTIVATVSTFFFRKTGRVYVGAFVCAWLVCWSLLGGFSLAA